MRCAISCIPCFSTLQRVEIAEIAFQHTTRRDEVQVSVLFNESKLLKSGADAQFLRERRSFSTLQRVEIAEIVWRGQIERIEESFSTLQRVEIAEMRELTAFVEERESFSTLQRVEIAEMCMGPVGKRLRPTFQYSSTSRNC